MKKVLFYASLLTFLVGCTESDNFVSDRSNSLKISLDGEIEQVYATRANDSGFAGGDVAGAYIVDYSGSTPGTLQASGNRANNIRMTYNASEYKWDMAYDVYFKDENTNVDIYSYYPFVSSISNVNAMEFEVLTDQSTEATSSAKGGYESSDFLWGKEENVAPASHVIHVKYHHKMASAKVVLLEGEGFDNGEWASLKKQVTVTNTKTHSVIDLATGIVSVTGEVSAKGIIPYQHEDFYRAIVVPQTITAGTNLFNINVGGSSYGFKRNDNIEYVSGKMNTFTFKVDKKTATGNYEYKLIGESITAWENDDIAHDAVLKEYVIINNTSAGHLDDAIAAAGKSLAEVRNLKILGEINTRDFAVMRFGMKRLQALNMKEVKIVKGNGGHYADNEEYVANEADEIPNAALSGKESLTSLILPDKLKIIRGDSGGGVGRGAFSYCTNLSGSLIIPEGVEVIEAAAFNGCTNYSGTLSLPSTLKQLGSASGYTECWDAPFGSCPFVCELKLPENLEVIGMGAFNGCSGFYGELKLPENLKELGAGAFQGCSNLSGSIQIPQGVSMIPSLCFAHSGFNGNLILHEGISSIGAEAFYGTPLKGALELPDGLKTLANKAFLGCDFSGELKLPTQLEQIGSYVFGDPWSGANWRLMGVVEIPQNVISIGEGAFYNCWSIEGFVFPKDLRASEIWLSMDAMV